MTTGASPWWAVHVHADRRARLLARNAIKKTLRRWFDAADFVEVECGALQVSPGNEAHLHAFATEAITPGGARERFYLHTSPEFASKKLLAAGESRIFDFARVFRNRERGAFHAPEFTMLEWYRADEPYTIVMDDCLSMLREAADVTQARMFSCRHRSCDPRAEPERITVAEAFERFADVDLLGTLSPDGEGDRDRLAEAARNCGVKTAENDTWPGHLQPDSCRAHREQSGHRQACDPLRIPALRGGAAHATTMIRASRNASSSMSAAWRSLTASANSPTRPSSAGASRPKWRKRRVVYGESYPDRRGVSGRAGAHAAGERVWRSDLDRLAMLATGARAVDDLYTGES